MFVLGGRGGGGAYAPFEKFPPLCLSRAMLSPTIFIIPNLVCECIHRAKNNVRTTVNFRANDGKDRSNDYTSGHYDRPGEYSALNQLIIYAIVRCPYGASAAIDRSIVRTYIYIYIVDRCVDARILA